MKLLKQQSLQLILVLLLPVTSLSGAVQRYSPSTLRILHLFGVVENDLRSQSPDLFEGLCYFFGTKIEKRDFKKAHDLFLSAMEKSSQIVRSKTRQIVRNKTHLYRSALFFMGGYGIEKSDQGAIYEACAVLDGQTVLPRDRCRAFLMLDEIAYAGCRDSNQYVPMLRVYAHKIAGISPCCASERDCCGQFKDELCYRIARNFWCGGGFADETSVYSAVMALNSLYDKQDRQAESLKKDIHLLRCAIFPVIRCMPILLAGVTDVPPVQDASDYRSSSFNPFEGIESSESSDEDQLDENSGQEQQPCSSTDFV